MVRYDRGQAAAGGQNNLAGYTDPLLGCPGSTLLDCQLLEIQKDRGLKNGIPGETGHISADW